ncbi:MAG: CtsR family transcriptional regulator [Selenomonadaceae bacterium]|nr:CtsR family transcriptional regulator [Selenomonadaceae bacterium]
MKQNIADLVEEHILKLLHSEKSGQIEIQRGEIADAMSCAPSQVTYVLSTRFTHDKGFVVESRRGLGGFIRISVIPLRSILFGKILSEFNKDSTLEDVEKIIRELYKINYISYRELRIIVKFAEGLFDSDTISAEDRFRILRMMFETLQRL